MRLCESHSFCQVLILCGVVCGSIYKRILHSDATIEFPIFLCDWANDNSFTVHKCGLGFFAGEIPRFFFALAIS